MEAQKLMENHYPTGAELAAFRLASAGTRQGIVGGVPMTFYPVGYEFHPADGRAWPHEREHGIGYSRRLSSAFGTFDMPTEGDIARREAARIRHAASTC